MKPGSSDISFLFAPRLYSWCCRHNAKKYAIFQQKEKTFLLHSAALLRFETLCRGATRHHLCRDTENSRWFNTSFAEVKYLKSDDFDQNIRVHIARLVTLSVRIIARCGLLRSNSKILCYDFDILIVDFGQDLARIQALLLLQFCLNIAHYCPYAKPNQLCQKAGSTNSVRVRWNLLLPRY